MAAEDTTRRKATWDIKTWNYSVASGLTLLGRFTKTINCSDVRELHSINTEKASMDHKNFPIDDMSQG